MTLRKQSLIYAMIALILSCSTLWAGDQAEPEKLYYAIEMGGVVCGYSEADISHTMKDGKDIILLQEKAFMMLSALGSQFNTEVKVTYHIDPIIERFRYYESHITQGTAKIDSTIHVEGNTARLTSSLGGQEKVTELSDDVVLENPLFLPHLLKDFVNGKVEKKTYKIYDVREGEIQENIYTNAGTEELELAGKKYNAIILDRLNLKNGLKFRWWINTENGYILKTAYQNRASYLTDSSVVKKIKMVEMDGSILAKTNKTIGDILGISYMKVRAKFEPVGLRITPEGLNVPGQKFAGTVKDNLVEGVFEIEHKHYDGSDAPPFPPDFSKDESLKKYLESQMMIESGDPVLIKKAQEITEGSKDSWEAANRLTKWVAENIDYAIPGGATARNTYDTRAGECGAHSLLLASFCRAVGIPARVVWGCMYTPNNGGSFGQHGWNEIYMGDAGWLPVDSTANEIDFADSGHIRVGELQSITIALNPKEMEILDYRIGSSADKPKAEASKNYEEYTGDYNPPADNRIFKVLVQDGSLAVDIPNQVVLALNDPDEKGLWYAKLSNRLYFIFNRDNSGQVMEMELHQITPMSRKSDPDEISEDAPEELRPYLGKYLFAALQAEFTVLYQDNSLAIDDPTVKKVVKLHISDDEGKWTDADNSAAISFELNKDGKVESMNVEGIVRFSRKMPELNLTPKYLNLAPGESASILISFNGNFEAKDISYELSYPDGFSVKPENWHDSEIESGFFQQTITASSEVKRGDYELMANLTSADKKYTSTIKLRVTDSPRILLLSKVDETEPLINAILSNDSNGLTWLTLEDIKQLEPDEAYLKQYDLLILDELEESKPLAVEQMEAIKEYVENGGSLLMFGGWYTCQGHDAENCGAYHQTPVESALPVTFSSDWDTCEPESNGVTGDRIAKPFKLKLADEHAITKGIDWQSVPEIAGYNRCESVKENGKVLVTNDNTGDPILVIGEQGSGKSAVFLSCYSRGWSSNLKVWDGFNQLWLNLVQWLAK